MNFASIKRLLALEEARALRDFPPLPHKCFWDHAADPRAPAVAARLNARAYPYESTAALLAALAEQRAAEPEPQQS